MNYLGASHELRGCINDAKDVRKFLISAYRNVFCFLMFLFALLHHYLQFLHL